MDEYLICMKNGKTLTIMGDNYEVTDKYLRVFYEDSKGINWLVFCGNMDNITGIAISKYVKGVK